MVVDRAVCGFGMCGGTGPVRHGGFGQGRKREAEMVELDCDAGGVRPRIGVIGVGGSGGNAVANMIGNGVAGVEFIAANTDAQALRASPAERIVQLGRRFTQGLGAGSRPEIGKAAAEEALPEIEAVLDGLHMCFIAAGMGGGTGTGAAPIIAEAARGRGILTVGVVTKPFAFEGARRARIAEAGLEELARHVDTLIVVPNQNLFRMADSGTTFKAAFALADDVLQQGVRGITDLMVGPGLINLDFADIRAIMADMGKAMMGSGEASGDGRAMRAAEQAISNPLLDHALKGARGLIISIVGGEDLRLMEVDEAAAFIKDMVDPEAEIIWGSAFNGDLEGRIRVSVVATGIEEVGDAVSSAPPAEAPAPELEPEMPANELEVEAPAPATQLLPAGLGLAPTAPEPDRSAIQEELALSVGEIVETVMPAVACDAGPAPWEAQPRGPSLFERMAAAARGAVRAQVGDDEGSLEERQRAA
jgi:cell division protein FtsZ